MSCDSDCMFFQVLLAFYYLATNAGTQDSLSLSLRALSELTSIFTFTLFPVPALFMGFAYGVVSKGVFVPTYGGITACDILILVHRLFLFSMVHCGFSEVIVVVTLLSWSSCLRQVNVRS